MRASARSRPTTCATTTSSTRCCASSAKVARARPRRSWRSSATCSRCTATRPRRKAGPARDRGGAYYSEAAAQLMASLADGRGDVQVVDLGTTARSPIYRPTPSSRFPRGSIATGRIRCRSSRWARVRELVLRVKAYERLVLETIRTHDRETALRALEANPLVGPYIDPEPLLDGPAGGEPGVSPGVRAELTFDAGGPTRSPRRACPAPRPAGSLRAPACEDGNGSG